MPLRQYGKAKAHVFLDVDINDVLRPCGQQELRRSGWGTKVVVTVGPSCQDVPTLVKLLQAGVTCARIDLSWGTKQYHSRSLANLNEAMRQTRLLCSVWLDTTGREVVVRRPIEYDSTGWPRQLARPLDVKQDQLIKITTDPNAEASASVFPVTYPGFPDLVEEGQRLQIGRYLATGTEGSSLYVEVLEVGDREVTCRAINSAVVDGLLTVLVCRVEDEDISADFALPVLTEHDVDCIRDLGTQYEADFITLSYCNSVDDLNTVRSLLDSLGMQQTKIIAKVERKAAVRNFEGIAHVADGIILSRGNLGLDFEPEVMALLQKRIISRCNQLGKPVLITRIVDSMVSAPRPTRAEATDVANAVLDGVDGMLLGAETLRGSYPVLTVETVLRLAGAAELHFDYVSHHEGLMGEAYEEEVSLQRADVSVADFHMFGGRASPELGQAGSGPAMHGRRVRSVGANLAAMPSAPLAQPEPLSPPMLGPAGLSGPQAMQGIGDGPPNGLAMAAASAGRPAGLPPRPPAHHGATGVANGGLAVSTAPSAAQPSGVMPAGTPAQHYISAFGSLPSTFAGSTPQLRRILQTHAPYMSKLESIASSATRTAEKINAGLIIVMVQTGRTVSLVSKYRPPMPIMAVVVPTLKADSLGWRLEGKFLARQTLVLRGVVPMLAAPLADAAGSEDLLSEAVHSAYLQRLVEPLDHVVTIMSHRGSMVVKVVQVNQSGTGVRCMGGQNSALLTAEAPDIIDARSPFGGFMPPQSPRAGGLPGHSPISRTLSGRPTPMHGGSPPQFSLGPAPRAAGGFGGLGGHMLVSTPSEVQGYDLSDLNITRGPFEAPLGRPARQAGPRGSSPLAGGGSTGGTSGGLASPTSPASPSQVDGPAASLSPIQELAPANNATGASSHAGAAS